MTRLCRYGIGLLTACALLTSVASARDIYVANAGNDGWSGTSSYPYKNIKTAISRAVSNDIIHVRAGIYNESYIQIGSGMTIRSEDGLYAAEVYSGNSTAFRFENGCTNSEVSGFKVHAAYAGGSGFDGLVRAFNCSNIRIKDLIVYDAPNDSDCIKIGGSGTTTSNILIENCVVYNPAPRASGGGYQECLDVYPADYVTIRHCWLYLTTDRGGDVLTFCKGGCTNITWENNVFGPIPSGSGSNPATMAGGPSPYIYPACTNFIARNNLFLNCRADGAFGLVGVRNSEFYNNVIWNYQGSRAAIEFYTPQPGLAINENFKCYNNIIMQTNGAPAFADRGKWTVDHTNIPTVFLHDNNIYWQTSGGDININSEPNSLFVNPLLASPATPVIGTDTWATIVPHFILQSTSPAIDEGYNLGALVPADIYGTLRPRGPAFDIGVYELPNRAPAASAGPDITAIFETRRVNLHATASDADGDPLSYAWLQTAGKAAVSPTGAAAADYSFTTPSLDIRSDGAMTFQVTVSDGQGGVTSDSVAVTVYMAGDANYDWYVNVADLQMLVAAWGSQVGPPPSTNWDPDADFDGDGFVNVGDLQLLAANWGRYL
jgi:hypothetical protein